VPTLSIEKSRNLASAGPKKGSAKSSAPRRRKATSATVIAKKPPRSVLSKSERAAAKTPVKAEEPNLERVNKQERLLTDAVEKSGFLLIVTVFRLRCTGG
jgi:hypothetical protein